ncbi:hypothetical protein AALP_AA1G321600 [Arabis alpina]|uniref:Phorbol-ester/DAG-type domain-containing protein n=1 Tax=Arabis alpina TaxID=50452 RepID=A0A087HS30_ARAAL|nr:hypothetical protein AALP_AA1G321600 [Arabis alpina]
MYARNPDGEKTIISLHRFADHPMTHLKDWRRGDCCGIKFETITDGYYCAKCKFFTHKTCSNPPSKMFPHLCSNARYREYMYLSYIDTRKYITKCDVCKGKMTGDIQNYKCYKCGLGVHLECAKYPPPEIIDVPRDHDHQLKLEMVESCFTCAACGKDGDGYPYKCHECDLTFHVNCEKYPAEVIHPFHPLHPLKLFKGEPPDYSGGTCRYCEEKLSNYKFFYHCSTCNFSLDQNCALNPPPQYLDDPNTHDHKLTLLPRLVSFTCNICGLSGDRSPYVCLQCNFMAHNTCQGFPWVIKTNRHDHCVSRTSLLGVVNSVCGVCRKKMDWSCGGYYCKRCPESTYHTKCATRYDVSDKREMKNVPEKDEDVKPFKVIDENTIKHFLHEEHNLRLDKSGIFIEERGSCKACAYPINHDSFYNCMSCDFILHESCAKMPTRKPYVLGSGTFSLKQVEGSCSRCMACGIYYNGFSYTQYESNIDVRCASISEPFVHQSHPHPLFYTAPKGVCSACNKEEYFVLKCVEDNCGYILDFKCALLPYEVKHKVDDHFLSLSYGENARGKYQCDICEKETDPKTWFYTCKDCKVNLHTDCVLGEFRALEIGRELTTFRHGVTSMAVHNNTMPQPLCNQCKSLCIFPIILKVTQDRMPDKNYPKYYCSSKCFDLKYLWTTYYLRTVFIE